MQTKNLPWEGYGYFLEPHILNEMDGSVRFFVGYREMDKTFKVKA